MTWPLVAGGLILAVLLVCWLAGAIVVWKRNHRKPPEPTPWADSTKVAQEVREMEAADNGRG